MQRAAANEMRGSAALPAAPPYLGGIPISVVIDRPSLPEALTCSICREMVDSPVMVTPCQHVFCSGCMARVRSDRCPLDRQPLPTSIPSLKTANPGLYRVWTSIKLRCPYAAVSNCAWEGCGEDYRAHAAACKLQAEAASQAPVAALQARIQALEADADRWRREAAPIAGLRDNVSRLTAEAAALTRSNMSLRASLSELQQGLEHTFDLEEQVASLRADAAQTVPVLHQRVAGLSQSNRELRAKISRLQDANHELAADSYITSLQVQSLQNSLSAAHVALDPTHRYTKHRTVELARLILQHLNSYDEPAGVDYNRIFNCIANIHNECQRGCDDNPSYLAVDLRMLLAVARASIWFTDKQKGRLGEIALKYA